MNAQPFIIYLLTQQIENRKFGDNYENCKYGTEIKKLNNLTIGNHKKGDFDLQVIKIILYFLISFIFCVVFLFVHHDYNKQNKIFNTYKVKD